MTTAPSPGDPGALWVERTGERAYVGVNERGASVAIGPDGSPGAFTPGELLKIALAACNAMSADHRLVHSLGPDLALTAAVTGTKIEEENRYDSLTVEIVSDAGSLDQGARDKLDTRVRAAIDRHCTVGRTLEAGTTTTVILTSETTS